MAELSEFSRSSISAASLASLASLLSPPAEVEAMQKFLRFRLDQTQSMLLAVENIAAVHTTAIADILPVPQMNTCVLGMSNWRGEALWLIDLAQQLGLRAIVDQAQRLTTLIAIVVEVNNYFLGLVVPEIYEIEEHNPKWLLSASADLYPQQILPFISGYFKHDRSVVLDASVVIQDPALQMHRFGSL